MKKIIKFIKKPRYILLYLLNKNWFNIFNLLGDKKYLKLEYSLVFKESLKLDNPQTFNEKLQWLKLYDRKPEYIKMVDKYEAKKYVSNIIGEQYIIPTLGIWDKFEDIDFNKLPNEFVLKPTHTSGDIYICKDKTKINYKTLKKQINRWLKKNYYYMHREWPYKNIKPRIIAEKYMKNENESELKDYKLFCFNGKTKMVLVCSERQKGLKKTFFDREWKEINVTEGLHQKDKSLNKPINFQEMISFAEKLSEGMIFLRVDFYEIKNKLYFGELTFYPNSGYEKFEPENYNKILGDMLELPKSV